MSSMKVNAVLPVLLVAAVGLASVGPSDSARMEAASEPTRALTAPGTNGRIAFTRYTDATRSRGAIFTIAADGSGERRVTHPPAGVVDFQPDWSPDGSRIVFERRYQDKPYEVFSVKPDGSGLRHVDPGCPPVSRRRRSVRRRRRPGLPMVSGSRS